MSGPVERLSTPIERLHRTVGRVLVTVAQLMDMHPGVSLRLQDGVWICEEAAPAVWFGMPFVWGIRADRVASPWCRRGRIVNLDAANGSWRWKLTDQYRMGTNPDGELRSQLGIWPD